MSSVLAEKRSYKSKLNYDLKRAGKNQTTCIFSCFNAIILQYTTDPKHFYWRLLTYMWRRHLFVLHWTVLKAVSIALIIYKYVLGSSQFTG